MTSFMLPSAQQGVATSAAEMDCCRTTPNTLIDSVQAMRVGKSSKSTRKRPSPSPYAPFSIRPFFLDPCSPASAESDHLHDAVASSDVESAMMDCDGTAFSEIVPCLLSKPEYLDQQILSKILCCSKGLCRTVQYHGSANLHAQLPDPSVFSVPSLAHWLTHYGHIVQSLDVGRFNKYTPTDSTMLAAALRAAASSPGLRLQQYHSTSEDSSNAILLAQLPPTYLTSLKATLTPANSLEAFVTIGQLTSLVHLQLSTRLPALMASAAPLSPLSNLQQLTALHIKRVLPADSLPQLQHLPASLQELEITEAAGPRTGQLILQHLTALRKLTLQYSSQWQSLEPEDILPCSLQALILGHCTTLTPVVGLSNLQELSVSGTSHPELQKLTYVTSLASLNKVALLYETGQDLATINLLSVLPMLHDLAFNRLIINHPVLPVLAKMPSMTRLALTSTTNAQKVQDLVSALKQLTHLQELSIDDANGQHPVGSDWPAHFAEVCTDSSSWAVLGHSPPTYTLLDGIFDMAVAGHLHSLQLNIGFKLESNSSGTRHDGGVGLAQCLMSYRYGSKLAAATQLTQLSLGGGLFTSWVSEGAVGALKHWTNLCSLSLGCGMHVTDSSLGCVARWVSRLTHLDISKDSRHVTAVGVAALTGLKLLRSLGLEPRFDARARRGLGLPLEGDMGGVWGGVDNTQ